jgi:PPK2 family polyphosphate:nucleotide phosphotransferase
MRNADQAAAYARPYRIDNGRKFKLKHYDPADTGRFKAKDKARVEAELQHGVKALAEMQDKLYAQNEWAVLLIFQAMDAAGKDGTIKHVMSGINPQGCQVFAFKAPSPEELDHDFLWRCALRLPERGRIGIFNRSYYEETLVVRVHPEFLTKQHLPRELNGKKIWQRRFEDINAYERHLSRNGVLIRKFFLHVSKEEQKKRFLERLEQPSKNWKFAIGDVAERQHWDEYMHAYEDMIRHTATEHAPWYVVPADNKWYTRMVVAAAIYDALAGLKLKYPDVEPAKRQELKDVREALLRERK